MLMGVTGAWADDAVINGIKYSLDAGKGYK